MPTVASRMLSELERRGLTRERISCVVVALALGAYTVKVAGGPLRRRLGIRTTPKATPDNNNLPTDDEKAIIEAERVLASQSGVTSSQPGLNREFIVQLIQLIRIMVPKVSVKNEI